MRSSIVTLVTVGNMPDSAVVKRLALIGLLGLVAVGCDRRGPGTGEKISPVTGPAVIWILEVANPIVWDMEHPEADRIRNAPDGEPMRMRMWYGGLEEDASEVVFVMRAWPSPPAPDGSQASGMGFGSGDCLAYRATDIERETATGRWREFRRLEENDAAAAIRAVSERRLRKKTKTKMR